jgi:hypothetical protein
MKMKIEARQQAENAIREAAEKWPSDFLTREDLKAFTGNAISVGHLANLDCKGQGPVGWFYLGRRLVYPKKSAVEWLISRMSFIGKAHTREVVQS